MWPFKKGNVHEVIRWEMDEGEVRTGHFAGTTGKRHFIVLPMPNLEHSVAVDKWQGPDRCVVDIDGPDGLYTKEWERKAGLNPNLTSPTPDVRRITDARILRPGPRHHMRLQDATNDVMGLPLLDEL